MKILTSAICILILIFSCSTEKQESTRKKAIPLPQQQQQRIFDYKPPAPVDGQLYATIELGALGLNYFIAEIDSKNRWDLKESYFGRSNIIYGVNTTNEILDQIEEYRNRIIRNSVNAENIHIIASSSAVKSSIIDKLRKELSSQNLSLNYINAKVEGQYALSATIPKEFIEESFLVDIGSGNTKLSWVDKGDTLSIDIHGSKYFLGDVQDTTVFREVRDAILTIPEKNRNLCFMLGGMIYEFEKTEIEKQNGNRYFVLKTPNEYPSDNEKLRAANVIYNALFLKPTYSYIFDSESNFSIGFLLALKK